MNPCQSHGKNIKKHLSIICFLPNLHFEACTKIKCCMKSHMIQLLFCFCFRVFLRAIPIHLFTCFFITCCDSFHLSPNKKKVKLWWALDCKSESFFFNSKIISKFTNVPAFQNEVKWSVTLIYLENVRQPAFG